MAIRITGRNLEFMFIVLRFAAIAGIVKLERKTNSNDRVEI